MDDALGDALGDAFRDLRPSDDSDSFDDVDDGRELEWTAHRSSFSPKNWPRVHTIPEKFHRNLPFDELCHLLGPDRQTNETAESMAIRLDAGHRNAMRKAVRRFNPKQRLLDQIDRFLLLLRAHHEWIDEHHTHWSNRLSQRPVGSESKHVEEVLKLRWRVERTTVEPFCDGHDQFLYAINKRSRRLNRLSLEILTRVQTLHTRAKGRKHNNWILALDIERTF